MEYDTLILRLSLSYPNIEPNQPKNLWNYNKYGLSNFSHIEGGKYQLHDYSSRAKELNLLPDATAIVRHFIGVVTEKYKDRVSDDDQYSSSGTLIMLQDIAEARQDIINLTIPYLTKPLQEMDFTEITNRFTGGRGKDGQQSQQRTGDGNKDEEEDRRESFASLVLDGCSGNYKNGTLIFEELLKARKNEWDPRTISIAWYLTGIIHFDSFIIIGPFTRFRGYSKREVRILDLAKKFVGQYGAVPRFQWSKDFTYKEGDNRFVFFEKFERTAVEKGFNELIGQMLAIRTTIPNYKKLYPYDFDENSLEYDGKISKKHLHEKYIYWRDFPDYVYSEKADSTVYYEIGAILE